MIDWADPHQVHEFAIAIFLGLFGIVFVVSMAYIRNWSRFMNELRLREPDLWKEIGGDTVNTDFFFPILQKHSPVLTRSYPLIKARRYDHRYPAAALAMQYGNISRTLITVMMGIVFFIVYWTQKHGI
ncbi:MAG TPA: hypothetical protein PLO23_01795 [Alphaproteobacteria bacterium]|nr:hypothetical protein [Alphaproteobacteria bacterium]